MRLYKVDKCRYTEIDVNSPKGIVIMNKCFDTQDINRGVVMRSCSYKDGMKVKFMLIVDEAYTIDEALERLDDGNACTDKLKESLSYVMESLSEFTKWLIKEYPGCKCTITIDDGCTNVDITDKTEEDTNEVK